MLQVRTVNRLFLSSEAYGGLKSAVQELSKQSDKMRMEVGLLQIPYNSHTILTIY